MTENAWGEDPAEQAMWEYGYLPSLFSVPQNEETVTPNKHYRIPGTSIVIQTGEKLTIYAGYMRPAWYKDSPLSELLMAYWNAKRYSGWAKGMTNAGLRDYGDFLVRLWAICEEHGDDYLESLWRLGGENAVRPLFGGWPKPKEKDT